MAFADPITAGDQLIHQAIKSEGFITGVTGWSVNKDGSAEFNNVTMRGSWQVTSPSTSRIKCYVDSNGFPIIEFTDGNGEIYTITAFTSAGSLAIFAGTALTEITELAFDSDGTVRFSGGSPVAEHVIYSPTTGFMNVASSALVEEGWHFINGQNGWFNNDGGYVQFKCRKLPDGMVALEGIMKPGTRTNGTVIGTLPSGYRPIVDIRHMLWAEVGIVGRLEIRPDGNIAVYGAGPVGVVTIGFTGQFSVVS